MSIDRKGTDPFEDAIDVSSRDGFTIEVQRPAPRVIVLSVEGALDLWTSLPLLDAILAAFHEHPGLIAIDLSDVPSIDDTCLHVLAEGARRIGEGQVGFVVICPAGSEVARLLEQTETDRAFSVHESVDDALVSRRDAAGDLPAGV